APMTPTAHTAVMTSTALALAQPNTREYPDRDEVIDGTTTRSGWWRARIADRAGSSMSRQITIAILRPRHRTSRSVSPGSRDQPAGSRSPGVRHSLSWATDRPSGRNIHALLRKPPLHRAGMV